MVVCLLGTEFEAEKKQQVPSLRFGPVEKRSQEMVAELQIPRLQLGGCDFF